MKLPEKLLSAIEQFRKIPGVGEKTALRQSLILTNWAKVDIVHFGESIKGLAQLKKCEECGMFTDSDGETICAICVDTYRRASKTICVVETVSDCLAIEKSEQFSGQYFILGGVLNPLLGIGPEQLRIDDLVTKIAKDEIYDIILAINPSIEGDATSAYLKQLLPKEVNVDRIGLGIPMGAHLEYLDKLTITKALENKTRL